MQINWYGQACLRFQGKDVSVLAGSFDEKEFGLKIPKAKDDLILNGEFSETDIKIPETFVIHSPGEYEVKGVFVYGIGPAADYPQIIYRFEMESLVVAHLGGISHLLDDESAGELGDVDILILPVGGHNVLNADQAAKTVAQIEPRLVIPMYYQIPGSDLNLDPVEKFVKASGLKITEYDKLVIKKKDLLEETQIAILKI